MQSSSNLEKTTSITAVMANTELNTKGSPPVETLVLGSDDQNTGEVVDVQPNSADEYVRGFKLALIVGSVALACFLMLLDTMVVSTVSCLGIQFLLVNRLLTT